MKCVGGIWLPQDEQHLVEWMTKHGQTVNGKLTYQYKKIEACMARIPTNRRRVAVDVGAHVGLWTMHLANWFEQVHAFEPNESLRPMFERNVTQQNVTHYSMALGPRPGSIGLRTFDGNSGHSMHAGVIDGGNIPMARLDDMNLAVCDFIKIDVEGFELGVVQGALQTIERCRPVMVVEEKGFAHEHGFPEKAAVKVLEGMGMKIAANIGGDHIMVWG